MCSEGAKPSATTTMGTPLAARTAARAMPVLGATAIRPSTPRLTRKPSASSISASSPTWRDVTSVP